MAWLDKILHISILAVYIVVLNYLISRSENEVTSTNPNAVNLIKFSARFLTKWTYVMQFIYYGIIVLTHLLSIIPSLHKVNDKLRSFADVLFTTIVIPVGLMVSIVFWSIYNFDRELVYPRWIDEIIPVWVNHALHTFNGILPLIDMLVVNHKFSSWLLTLSIIALYFIVYLVCLLETYYTHGQWLYPIFGKLTYPQRAIFCLGIFCTVVLFHAIARLICSIRWGLTTEKPKKNKRKMKKTS